MGWDGIELVRRVWDLARVWCLVWGAGLGFGAGLGVWDLARGVWDAARSGAGAGAGASSVLRDIYLVFSACVRAFFAGPSGR